MGVCVCVCLSVFIYCVRLLRQVCFTLPFCVSSGDFTSSSSTSLRTPPEVCLCLCFISKCYLPPSPPSAPPYLSPMEMHWGQGIWGEEHREAALHNLKGILMNQHSRTDYSHDNRPQTNSCIWSPLVLWLWKCCLCVCVHVCGCFCFPSTVWAGWVSVFVYARERVHTSISSKKLAWELICFNVCTRSCNYCLLWPDFFFSSSFWCDFKVVSQCFPSL